MKVRFLSDPQGEWAKAAKLDWDATSIMGNRRSKRFVAVIEVPPGDFKEWFI
jgi:peroxiredoxin